VHSTAVPVIHAVTDDVILIRPDFLARASVIMRTLGERGAVHLRGRHPTTAHMFDMATRLVDMQTETGCRLVVNDRIDVARAAGAWGAQLTSRSIPVGDARLIGHGLLIGASIHSDREADEAELAGADWIVLGNIFETRSHPDAPGTGIAALRGVCARSAIPCIAIGGVRPPLVGELLRAGAHGVAAISGIWNAADAERAAIDYLAAYDAERAHT